VADRVRRRPQHGAPSARPGISRRDIVGYNEQIASFFNRSRPILARLPPIGRVLADVHLENKPRASEIIGHSDGVVASFPLTGDRYIRWRLRPARSSRSCLTTRHPSSSTSLRCEDSLRLTSLRLRLATHHSFLNPPQKYEDPCPDSALRFVLANHRWVRAILRALFCSLNLMGHRETRGDPRLEPAIHKPYHSGVGPSRRICRTGCEGWRLGRRDTAYFDRLVSKAE